MWAEEILRTPVSRMSDFNIELLKKLINYCFGGFSFFLPHHMACEILVSQPRIKAGPSAVKAQSPNHWTAREFPQLFIFKKK